MAKEWKQICKDCGKEFGYSDISLQRDLRKGLSRTERCDDCRKQHALEIKSIASSHFALKPRKTKPSILGYPFLGQIEHGERILKEVYKEPVGREEMDFGLKEHHIKQIYETLEENQVLVIVAPTGTGKSTFLPSKFIDPLKGYPIDYFTKRGPIIVTQPRIPAARDIPKTIGNKLVGSSVGTGYDIGFRHGDGSGKRRGDNFDRKRNRLIFVTDGSLINWLEEGQIADFSMIIVDEAHERSCNIDLILGLVKQELLKYPHLKFIIASATIDADSFVNYFSQSTTVKALDFSDCQKTFGYEEAPWKISELKKEEFEPSLIEKNKDQAKSELKKYEREAANNLANKIVELLNKTDKGGIVGFLHGEEHINRAVKLVNDKIKGRRDVKVFPLYTGVGTDNIEAALADIKERRVVIATNIAETSLTIRDIVYVVDSGLIKKSDWNPITCRQELNTKFHSKDGCKQRWGRAGRVQKGFVYKLYTKDQFIKYFPNHTPPEIQRSNAENIILGAMASGVSDIENFSLLEKPDKIEFDRALNVVKKRGIIDADFDFTEDGREVYRLSKALSSVLDKVEYNSTQRALDVASFLILADKYACLIEAVTAICMMPRMGNALYWQGDGLLQWDKNLNLVSKDYRIRLIDSFKAGCIDDLDFACKLYSLYEGCFFDQKLGEEYKSWFAKEYSLNLENFNRLNETRNNLIDVFRQGKKSSSLRQLDLTLVARVRVLASLSWLDRVVSIKKSDNLLFESKEYDFKGTISENCAGNWGNEKKAVIGILAQNENDIFIDGKKTKAPVANFLIKYVEPVPTKNVIDIINAFRNYSKDDSVVNSYANCVSDLNISINKKIEIDETISAPSIKKSFSVSKQYSDSTNTDDLFIWLQHRDSEKESKSVFEIETEKGIKAGQNLILEKWIKKGNKVAALVDNFLNYEPTVFPKLKVGEKVETRIKRPIFNIKGNGFREIVGFIISIEGCHYSLPIVNVSIELQNDSLKELVGQKLTLIKTGVTSRTHQPVFSIIPFVEKERMELVKLNEVSGKVAKITGGKVYFNVKKDKGEFTHLVAIPTAFIKDNMKYLELGGDVTIKVKLLNEGEERITVDCLDDDDLVFEEIDEVRELLRKIENNISEYTNFRKRNILINETEIVTKTTISFEHFNELSHLYPILHSSLRKLYALSWELNGFLSEIKKAFDELFLEVSKMKSKAKSTNYLAMQEILKQFKWHTIKLSELQSSVIKSEVDKIWEITRKQSDIEYRKNNLIPRFRNDLVNIPTHQTNRRASINQKISKINLEIAVLEAEILGV
jgi:HrpA-like RNA helicase